MNGMLCVINTEVSGGRFNKKVVAVNMDGGGASERQPSSIDQSAVCFPFERAPSVRHRAVVTFSIFI